MALKVVGEVSGQPFTWIDVHTSRGLSLLLGVSWLAFQRLDISSAMAWSSSGENSTAATSKYRGLVPVTVATALVTFGWMNSQEYLRLSPYILISDEQLWRKRTKIADETSGSNGVNAGLYPAPRLKTFKFG